MKKISLIILTIILSISFISCSRTDDNGDITNGYSKVLAETNWVNEKGDHEIYFGTPHFESTCAPGTFSDGELSGTYNIYENKYMNDIFTSFENCSQETQDEFWNKINDKNTAKTFGLVTYIDGNEYKRFEYFGCLDNDTLILCDYTNVYEYKKTEGKKDKLMKELNVTSVEADNILSRIDLQLTTDFYSIDNISKNPELGKIIETTVISTNEKYFIYVDDSFNVLLVTKDNLEKDGGAITFRQKE